MISSKLITRRDFATKAKVSVAKTFKAGDLKINPVEIRKIKPVTPGSFTFGKYFTDHMIEVDWNNTSGW
jgi:hypothetical protein